MKASTQSRLKLIARLRPTAEPILMVFQGLDGMAKGGSWVMILGGAMHV